MLRLYPGFIAFIALAPLVVPGSSGFGASGSTKEPHNPRCQICKQLIQGAYYRIPGLPEVYCENCHKSLPHCFYCGRPFRADRKEKRPVCDSCLAESVTDPQEALKTVKKVHAWIRLNLPLEFPKQIDFDFVEDLAPYVGVNLTGTTRELGAYIRQGDHVRVLLLENMPMCALIEAVAHELAHVWQTGSTPRSQRLLTKEGFAQWVASKALAAFQCHSGLRVLALRKDLYGEGYRQIKEIEGKSGIQGVFRYIERAK